MIKCKGGGEHHGITMEVTTRVVLSTLGQGFHPQMAIKNPSQRGLVSSSSTSSCAKAQMLIARRALYPYNASSIHIS